MRKLIILGAGGFGREVYWLAQACMKDPESPTHHAVNEVRGFLDDRLDALDATPDYPPVLGTTSDYEPRSEDVFVCALGDPTTRRRCVEALSSRGATFISLVHPAAHINPSARIGLGCLIFRDVGLSCEVTLGSFVVLQNGCILGHDVTIGDYCQLNARVFIGGEATIGDRVSLHVNAIVHPGKHIEERATIGAGAFVFRDVKAGRTVYGNPGRILK